MQQSDLNGILLMNKPQGFTSHDVVAKLRGILHTRRIGHGGTLDPMATGVLPVFVGGATKAADFAAAQDKEYVAGFTLGYCTDTQDVTGEMLQTSERYAAEYAVKQMVRRFVGPQQQVPPMYSAVKVNGQKLYDLARKGREVERPARDIIVHEMELLDFDENAQKGTLRCKVSKGTYVRTLCHDIGQALGCGGCMAALRRTMAAGFTLSDAVTLEQVQMEGEALLRPVDSLFRDRPAYVLPTPRAVARCRNGNPVSVTEPLPEGEYRVYDPEGDFLCLSRLEGGVLTSIKNFFGA